MTIDFAEIKDEVAIDLIKKDFNIFKEAMVKMMLIDNYDQFLPKGLIAFAEFFFLNHENIYHSEQNYKKLYTYFLKWLEHRLSNKK
ncbi:MAG: hypothetical protein JXA54_07320 [Candidatus Heimdallarchaeota archaeon]|nr:hypothetical protein [Candidatus Heimdallarchaeota archaeon]